MLQSPRHSALLCRALGCVMYELTCLRPAFTAFNLEGLIQKIQKASVGALPMHYSNDWCCLVKSMLRKDPTQRPTIMQMLSDPCLTEALQKVRRNLALDIQGQCPLCCMGAGSRRYLPLVHRGRTQGKGKPMVTLMGSHVCMSCLVPHVSQSPP